MFYNVKHITDFDNEIYNASYELLTNHTIYYILFNQMPYML